MPLPSFKPTSAWSAGGLVEASQGGPLAAPHFSAPLPQASIFDTRSQGFGGLYTPPSSTASAAPRPVSGHKKSFSYSPQTQAPSTIRFYRPNEPHFFLTNFSPHSVSLGPRTFKTAEAAYQAQKFASADLQDRFTSLSGQEALDLSRKLKTQVRDDWFDISLRCMNGIIALKLVQHPELKRKLLATGDAQLIENSPVDSFYGCGEDGTGQNELGKIWMRHRRRLNAEQRWDTVDDVLMLRALEA